MGRALPSMMSEAVDQSRIGPRIVELLEGLGCQVDPRAVVTIEPLRRTVVRYSLVSRESADSSLRRGAVLGKVYESVTACRRAFDTMQRLAADGFAEREPRNVQLPDVYACWPKLHLVLFEEVPGASLRSLVKSQAATGEHLEQFASALDKLHTSQVRLGEPFTVRRYIDERCIVTPAELAEGLPELASQIRHLIGVAEALSEQIDPDQYGLIHGDFHFGQAHVDRQQMWLLDFDRMTHGDPAYDLAMFLIVLKRMEAGADGREYATRLRSAFVRRYFSDHDWNIARRIPLSEALIHLKRACKRFVSRDTPDWRTTVTKQIQQAANCVEVAQQAPRITSEKELNTIYDACPGAV